MDQVKTGKLIRELRIKRGLTQNQLGELINVSGKTVSKWECGCGCPDISLLESLSKETGAELKSLLSGEMHENSINGGNMKKNKFYVCPICGNIIMSCSEITAGCCGICLEECVAEKSIPESESLHIERTDGMLYITSSHDMTKEHYITYSAFISDNTVTMQKHYPEWSFQMRLPANSSGRLVWHCNVHGMFYMDIRPGK